MDEARRAGGFERLGAGGAASLGLGAARTRALDLESAWRRAAGASIAARASVLRLRRGVLEIDVPDPAWRRAVAKLLPEIAARMRRAAPALAIDAVRIVDAPIR